MIRWFAAIVLGFTVTNTCPAQVETVQIAVTTDKRATSGPICIPLSISKDQAKSSEVGILIVDHNDKPSRFIGQLTHPGIRTESIKPQKDDLVRRDLHLLLPEMPAMKQWKVVAIFMEGIPSETFGWTEKKGEYQELTLTRSGTSTPYLRYMKRPYDASTADARNKSYKVFHHLYDPAGKRFVTNGGFTDTGIDDPKKLLYPHHRGIMYGFNRCSYGPDLKLQADTWHCPPQGDKKKVANAAHVAHLKTLGAESWADSWPASRPDRLVWRRRQAICGGGTRVDRLPRQGGTLVEFASRLKTTGGKVRVDGDPQHAGFQFRAANDVRQDQEPNLLFASRRQRRDGQGTQLAGRQSDGRSALVRHEFRPRQSALHDVLPQSSGQSKDSRFSERDYGRFGGYFAQDITEDRPLVVNYRLWLQPAR